MVLQVPTIRAFRTGCMLDVEVVSRQGGLAEDDWWDLHSSAQFRSHELRGGAPLPRKPLRLGVRYADGRKATTIEQRPRGTHAHDDPPPGPPLSYQPGNSGCTAGNWALALSGCGCAVASG